MCTTEYYPELVQAVRETKAHLAQYTLGDDNDRDDIVLRLGDSQEKENVPDYMDSSPPLYNLVESSDVESHASSIDSIQKNADFVALLYYPLYCILEPVKKCLLVAEHDTCFRRLQAGPE